MRETITGVAGELAQAGVENARVESELLVAAVTGLVEAPRSALLEQGERDLTTAEARTLAGLVLRRRAGEPVQYLTRRAWFRDLTLEVGPGVLIPRPETEVLAEEVLGWIRAHRSNEPTRVLDLGTGTGCLALSLALESSATQVLATDLSHDALQFARKNRDRLAHRHPDAARRVEFLRSDLFSSLSADEKFHVIVSNPPYVAPEERGILPREVREHEPEMALYSESGTAALHAIIQRAYVFLLPNGLLALEIGEGQADNVAGQIARIGRFGPARTVKDLAGKMRIVLAERSPGTESAQGGEWQRPPL